MADMYQGTVKFFNVQKGFGFITPEDGGQDVFVHISELRKSGITSLTEGQAVSYAVEKTPKGMNAVNVSIVE